MATFTDHRLRALLQLTLSACLQLASLSVVAQSDKPFAAPQETVHAATSGAAGLTQVTLSLILVLAAVFAAAWLVRRLRGLGTLGSPAITVIAEVGLGPKERAVLVQIGTKQLLLGVAPGRVSTLHVLEETVSISRTASDAAQTPLDNAAAVPDFKTLLKRSLGLK